MRKKTNIKNEKKQRENLFKATVLKRRAFFFLSDVLLLSLAMYISFWNRFNGAIPTPFIKIIPYSIALALVIKLAFLMIFNLYDISWRFVGLEELIKVIKAISLGSLTLAMVLFFLRFYAPFSVTPFPRSILLIDYLISVFLIGSLRISKRVLAQGLKNTLKFRGDVIKILIIGAGNAGEQIIREMTRPTESNYVPVGFVDDEPAKQGIKIHGVKVLGKRKDIPELLKVHNIDEVLIAIPSAASKEIKDMVRIVRESKKMEKIKILPSAADLLDGKVTLSDIHKIKFEDLMGRFPVEVDHTKIRKFLNGKIVMVTGAGGSVGSELVKSILQFNPESLIALDTDETELFYLFNKLKFSKTKIIPMIGDIRDKSRMEAVFQKHSPQIVLHAAAYKHVPILEFYPEEAVKTNIQGTKIVAELSLKHNVEKFILISTDKAISPTSVMGATKRCVEDLLKELNRTNETKFISVRFGNVLGSRGSVLPLFKEQIKKGGPVTVTHPEMKRYFMSPSEAVLLVLEASSLGEGGEVFVLDMGEPIKILDIAKEMIRLSGYEPDSEIPIVFSEIRPGEKIFEEILSAEEGANPTEYEKIFIVKNSKEIQKDKTGEEIDELIKISIEVKDRDEIIALLKEIVPSYTPSQYLTPGNYW